MYRNQSFLNSKKDRIVVRRVEVFCGQFKSAIDEIAILPRTRTVKKMKTRRVKMYARAKIGE